MRNSEKIFKKNKDMVSRKIGDEMILVPIFKTDKNINEMYTLNETAERIWNLIDGKKTTSNIKAIMCRRYKVAEKRLEKDFERTIEDLKKIKAIV